MGDTKQDARTMARAFAIAKVREAESAMAEAMQAIVNVVLLNDIHTGTGEFRLLDDSADNWDQATLGCLDMIESCSD